MTNVDDIERALDTLLEAGANAVAWNPPHYMFVREGEAILDRPSWEHGLDESDVIWEDVGQTKERFARTPSPDLVEAAVEQSHMRAMLTAIKPLVDPRWHPDGYPGGWRGDVSMKGTDVAGIEYNLQAQWHRAYKRLLDRYIGMLGGGDICMMGTEFVQATRDFGPQWVASMARYLRTNHSPTPYLTYDANWGPCHDAEYWYLHESDVWKDLAYTCVSAYFPLVLDTEPPSPPIDAIRAGWHRGASPEPWCLTPVAALSEAASGIPAERLLFGEIGYRADEWAAHNNPGEDPKGKFDQALQARCWQAFREEWDGNIAGWFAWSWAMYPEYTDPRAHALNLPGREETARWALSEAP